MASNAVYSATYSNVPVFEFITDTKNGPEHVMRRRQDNWINATHILKVAEQQKASRTRILEREIQKDVHEKIQGGYGKFQGTWVPLQKGKELAQRNGVFEKLRPLFDYMAGDVSPPQAPKHTTAASHKVKGPMKAAARPKKATTLPAFGPMADDRYDNSSPLLNDDESIETSSIISDSNIGDHESYQKPQQGLSRKRKRELEAESQDVLYGDSLLDYFMLSASDTPILNVEFPLPPAGFQINRHIDGQNHTALHWGAAMGDIKFVNAFLNLGADVHARNIRGETPILRAVIFTNNHARKTLNQLVDIFQQTIQDRDDFGGTAFHHAAALTLSHSKKKCASYYLEVLLNKLNEITTQQDFFSFMNLKDHKGDTALHIVARNDAKRCVRILQGHGVASDIPNGKGETVDQIIHQSRKHHADQYAFASSSPVQPEGSIANGNEPSQGPKSSILPIIAQCESQSAQSFRDSFSATLPDKALQLILDMEESVQDKAADHAEATRLLQNVTAELEKVRRETIDLLSGDFGDDDDDQLLREEVEALEAEHESLLEQHQHKTLHKDVRTSEQNLPPSAHHDRTKGNGDILDEGELERKVRAALSLADMQTQRKLLAKAVVQAQATAGMSEKGETYKHLLSSSMGTSIDEVTDLIPELLEVLEMSNNDTASQTG